MLDQSHAVVVPSELWEAMLTALQLGLAEEALNTATVAPLQGEFVVVQETDVLASQGLFSYAANVRTAVEFTETNGLCVMTDETRTTLTDLAALVWCLGDGLLVGVKR